MKLKSLASKICLTLILVIAYASMQCSKTTDEADPVTPAFPDKYCGTFAFTVIDTYHNPEGSTDTAFYDGIITISDATANKLEILYTSGKNYVICNGDSIWGASIRPVIDKNGTLDYPAANGCGTAIPFSGAFVGSDTVTFTLATGGNWWHEQKVTGVRKDN